MNTLQKIKSSFTEGLGWFAFAVLLLLIGKTGLDYMVTGKINPGIERQLFLAYVAWHILMNQGEAVIASYKDALAGDTKLFFLKYITVLWTWFGGALDWLYFMMKGWMPPLYYIWHWILPFWNTLIHGIYSLIWFVGLIVGWYLYKKHKRLEGGI